MGNCLKNECEACGKGIVEGRTRLWFYKEYRASLCPACSTYVEHLLWELDEKYRSGYSALPHVVRMLGSVRASAAEGHGKKEKP